MPTPWVKKIAKETGHTVNEVEGMWDKAKVIVSKITGKKEADFTGKEYAMCTNQVKKMLSIDESLLDPELFINSDKNASDYLDETMSSSGFNIGNVIPPNVIPANAMNMDGKSPDGDVGDDYGMSVPPEYPGAKADAKDSFSAKVVRLGYPEGDRKESVSNGVDPEYMRLHKGQLGEFEDDGSDSHDDDNDGNHDSDDVEGKEEDDDDKEDDDNEKYHSSGAVTDGENPDEHDYLNDPVYTEDDSDDDGTQSELENLPDELK